MLCHIMLPSILMAQEAEKKDTSELLDRIQVLEQQLKRIEEENKARKSLEITEEEKQQQGKEVLSAVSREYTLSPKGTLALDYALGYSYSPSEYISTEDTLTLRRLSDHTIQHSIYTAYSILDNLTGSVTLPIVYRYHRMGTDDQLDETDIGDLSLGVAYQPTESETGDVQYTLSLGGVLPTGRSPYTINPDTELSTGSGLYSVSMGGSFSKQVDPVVMFWSLGLSYPFALRKLDQRIQDQVTLEKVDPGMSFNGGMGMAYALSYANSINIAFSYQYSKSSTLTYKELQNDIKTGDSVSASLSLGMGIKVTSKTTVSVGVGYNLTSTGFSVTARIPFNFML